MLPHSKFAVVAVTAAGKLCARLAIIESKDVLIDRTESFSGVELLPKSQYRLPLRWSNGKLLRFLPPFFSFVCPGLGAASKGRRQRLSLFRRFVGLFKWGIDRRLTIRFRIWNVAFRCLDSFRTARLIPPGNAERRGRHYVQRFSGIQSSGHRGGRSRRFVFFTAFFNIRFFIPCVLHLFINRFGYLYPARWYFQTQKRWAAEKVRTHQVCDLRAFINEHFRNGDWFAKWFQLSSRQKPGKTGRISIIKVERLYRFSQMIILEVSNFGCLKLCRGSKRRNWEAFS